MAGLGVWLARIARRFGIVPDVPEGPPSVTEDGAPYASAMTDAGPQLCSDKPARDEPNPSPETLPHPTTTAGLAVRSATSNVMMPDAGPDQSEPVGSSDADHVSPGRAGVGGGMPSNAEGRYVAGGFSFATP